MISRLIYLTERLYVPTIVAQISSSAEPLPASLRVCFRAPGPEDISTNGACPLLLNTGLPNLHHRSSYTSGNVTNTVSKDVHGTKQPLRIKRHLSNVAQTHD